MSMNFDVGFCFSAYICYDFIGIRSCIACREKFWADNIYVPTPMGRGTYWFWCWSCGIGIGIDTFLSAQYLVNQISEWTGIPTCILTCLSPLFAYKGSKLKCSKWKFFRKGIGSCSLLQFVLCYSSQLFWGSFFIPYVNKTCQRQYGTA